ncbi:hypothetical protein OOZ51_00265 [Arthrobacter sp. MI7-26]|nr:hypothetical protein [Arthrobacter sp. MI7-26]
MFGSIEGDDSAVVAVAEQPREVRWGNSPGRTLGTWLGRETAVFHGFGEVGEGVVAGGVELKGLPDERAPDFVNRDGADFPSFEVLADVEVADGSTADRAALLRFLGHLVFDVGAVFGGAIFIESREQAVHELADGAGVDGLGGADQGDPALFEVGHDDGVVGAVSGEAGEFVDHDVVDVPVCPDPTQHFLEGHALGHLRSAAAWFDVLGDDCQAHLFDFAQAGFALGGDGDAFGVVVGVDLPFGGNAEVENGSGARWGVFVDCRESQIFGVRPVDDVQDHGVGVAVRAQWGY